MKQSDSFDGSDNVYHDRQLLEEHFMSMKLTYFSYHPEELSLFPEEYGKIVYHQREAQVMLPSYFISLNQSKQEIYLVVRGSKEANDLFADADGTVVDLYGSTSHGGFVQSGINLFNSLPQDIINSAIEDGCKFYFIGHSLGGACASVVMMMFKEKYPNIRAKGVTFGCPGLLLPEYSEKWKDPSNWCIDSIFHVGDPIPFSCNHNILASAKTKFEFFANISKALVDKPEYFPLSFLNLKSHEETSSEYELLVPPGRLFAIGVSSRGSIQIERYEGTQYFDGFQPFLTQACHLVVFYMSSMEWFVEKAKIDDILSQPIELPEDFIPAIPISA